MHKKGKDKKKELTHKKTSCRQVQASYAQEGLGLPLYILYVHFSFFLEPICRAKLCVHSARHPFFLDMANDGHIKSPTKWFRSGLRLSFQSRLSRSRSRSRSRSSSSPSSSRQDELRGVFAHFDTDGDGKISASELRAYFRSVGETLTVSEAQGVIEDHDADGDGLIDFDDFVRLMKMEGGPSSRSEEEEEDLRRAFEMFEHEKGSGCINPKGLQMMLRRLGDSKSHDDCVAMIRVYDVDGDGVLDFHEFHQMMAC